MSSSNYHQSFWGKESTNVFYLQNWVFVNSAYSSWRIQWSFRFGQAIIQWMSAWLILPSSLIHVTLKSLVSSLEYFDSAQYELYCGCYLNTEVTLLHFTRLRDITSLQFYCCYSTMKQYLRETTIVHSRLFLFYHF